MAITRRGATTVQSTPVGQMQSFAGATAPAGWLLCDGTAVSRTTYAQLFALLSTTFGVGDGSTTFNLPDLRDRFAMGVSGTKTRGSTAGAETLPNHAHSSTLAAPAHTHTLDDNGQAQFTLGGTAVSVRRITAAAYTTSQTVTTAAVAADATSRTQAAALQGNTAAESATALTGSIGNPTTSPSILTPYQAVQFIIKY